MMEKRNWKPYAISVLIAEAIGALAGALTRGSMAQYEALEKPPLTPPSAVFPVVWAILFLLMGIGAALIYEGEPGPNRRLGLRIYGVQLAFNFLWSIAFFNLQVRAFAFFWLMALWVLIIWMIVVFRRVSPAAAWMQVPYLLWVTFAAYLNLMIWLLNR